MIKIRVKQIADNELELTILPATPQVTDPVSEDASRELTFKHAKITQEREAAEELKSFLKDGKRPARECWAFLKSAGFQTDEMNPTRVRHLAGVDTAQKERKSWWFLSEPLREAAVELKTFLKNGERLTADCHEHLAALNLDEMNLWLVRRYAGVEVAQKDGESWWFVSDRLVEIAESFQFEDDPRLELIDEDNCGYIGWDEVTK